MFEKISENIRWIIFTVGLVGLLGVVVWLSSKNKIDVSKVNQNQEISSQTVNGEIGDHIFGDTEKAKNAKVTLIEYGDFQCPSCATMSKKIKSFASEYEGKVKFIFRNFPLEGHPNALSAASAAEAAGIQGKYFEMLESLFENQSEWSSSSASERTDLYKKYAKNLGLDESKFIEDMKSSKVSSKIKFDKALGNKSGVTGTPSFYLNGESLDSEIWRDDAKFREKIDSLLK